MTSIPDLFCCPISLDLFTDPVTLCTGQTYDRPFIEKWIADGNLTCPVTMQRLEDTSVVPNHTLRHLINQWLLCGPASDSGLQSSSHLGQFSFSALRQNLQSPEVDFEVKLHSLQKIRLLAVESDTGCSFLIQLGFLPLLLQLLLQSSSTVNGQEYIAELALECILSILPSANLNILNILKNESNLEQLVLLLEQGNANVKSCLCYLIEIISLSDTTRELCLLLGQSHRLLQLLTSFLYGSSDAAVRAISSICRLETNRDNVVKAGGIDGLIAYLSNSSPQKSLQVLTTLEMLVRSEIGKKATMKNSSVIDVLVKNIYRVSSDQDQASEHAIETLLTICGSSRQARTEAVSSGVVMQLLLLIQSQCSVEAKAKAGLLLKLFRFMWAEEK